MIQDSRKMMIYLPRQQSERVNALAKKLDRPRSWIIQKALDLSYDQLQELAPQFSKKWKENFMKELSKVDKDTKDISEEEIEAFAVEVVRDYRKKHRKKSS